MSRETSWCSRCQSNLPVSRFNMDNSRPSGYQGNCKSCVKELREERNRRSSDLDRKRLQQLESAWNRIQRLESFIREQGLTPPE
jgi:hypothetical protein